MRRALKSSLQDSRQDSSSPTHFLMQARMCTRSNACSLGSGSCNRWQTPSIRHMRAHTRSPLQFGKHVFTFSLWHSWADCGSLCFPLLTELSPLGFISTSSHDFAPLSHPLHFHWHWHARQVRGRGGRGVKQGRMLKWPGGLSLTYCCYFCLFSFFLLKSASLKLRSKALL